MIQFYKDRHDAEHVDYWMEKKREWERKALEEILKKRWLWQRVGTDVLQDDSRGFCKEKVISCLLREVIGEKKKWVGDGDRLPCCKVYQDCLDYRKYSTAA